MQAEHTPAGPPLGPTSAAMELVLEVVAAGRPPAAVVVDAEAGTTVAELGAVLAARLKVTGAGAGSDQPVFSGTIRLRPEAPLAAAGLVHGSTVGLGGPAAEATVQPALFELAVIGGAAAGPSIALPAAATLTVGREANADLAVPDAQVSRRHARVTATDGSAVVEDIGSRNGVGWRGHRIAGPQPLQPDDVFQVGESVIALRRPAPPVAVVDPPGPAGTRRFNRPPRIPPPAPDHELEVPTEPSKPPGRRFPLASILAPIAIGLVLVVVLKSLTYAVFIALSPIMVAANYLSDRRSGRREYRAKLADYRRAVAELDAALAASAGADERARRDALPDPAALVRIAQAPTARLWERRPDDADFLSVRVGLTSRPAGLRFRGPAPDRAPVARLVPVAFDLAGAGVAGLAGPRPMAMAWARAALAQIAALHSPREVAVVVLTGQGDADDWAWTLWLPHLVPPDPGWGCRRLVAAGRQQVEERLADLRRLIDERQEATRTLLADQPAGRRVVVVLDGARRLRVVDGLSDVLRRGPGAGVYALCLDEHEHNLPEECRVAVSPEPEVNSRVILRRKGVEPVADILPDGMSEDTATRLALAIAPLRDAAGVAPGGGEVPRSARLLELLGLDSPGSADVRRAWTASPGGRCTEAVVGAGGTGPFAVDLRADGPHGLVAGTTGAGKSELLQTLVTSLAVGNRPDALNFVLVDYKGGSAFKDCRLLPHCVGLVTDLDGHLAARALASLTAELKRRETLLAAAGAKDIEEYWALTDGQAPEPLPRLVIVIDEFATLVEEVPEFVSGVVGIGMRGRSLGVHVLLATQRPGGTVSADMRANLNLRICLRVADNGDSVDVIGVPDAARIGRETPGRAYARTGYNDLTLFQAARVGVALSTAAGPEATAGGARRAPQVEPLSVPAMGNRPPEIEGEEGAASGPTELTLLVAAVNQAACELGVQAGSSPWLPPLGQVIPVQAVACRVGPDAVGPLRAVIGVVDVPEAQTQEPFVLDLARAGSVLVGGSVRSGRSTTLRTIAAGLCRSAGPADLHMYAIDCGNRALDPLAALPHCGAVVSADDPDRLTRLMQMLGAQVQSRARSGSGDPGPAVVVLVDRLEAFVSRYGERDGGQLVDAFDRLLREGRAVGVHFVMSGDRTAFTSRLASAVEARLVLRQADRSDYSLFGLDARQVPAHMPNGRAIWAQDGHEVQIAVLGTDGTEDSAGIRHGLAGGRADWTVATGPSSADGPEGLAGHGGWIPCRRKSDWAIWSRRGRVVTWWRPVTRW